MLNVEIRDCFEVIGFMIASYGLRPKFRRGVISIGIQALQSVASSLCALTCQTYKCLRAEKSSKTISAGKFKK